MRRFKEDYQKIKVAKANHKEALKNKAKYKTKRDELVYQMLQTATPRWGGVRINLIDW